MTSTSCGAATSARCSNTPKSTERSSDLQPPLPNGRADHFGGTCAQARKAKWQSKQLPNAPDKQQNLTIYCVDTNKQVLTIAPQTPVPTLARVPSPEHPRSVPLLSPPPNNIVDTPPGGQSHSQVGAQDQDPARGRNKPNDIAVVDSQPGSYSARALPSRREQPVHACSRWPSVGDARLANMTGFAYSTHTDRQPDHSLAPGLAEVGYAPRVDVMFLA
jgi:hypothetical protein